MIIEETTTYAYKLKYIENVSFNRIRAFAQSFVNELPQELVDDIYEQLNHGLDLLQNEPQMLVYLHSYGKMHEAKLRYAFDQLPEDFREQPKVNIIDYGCGQAFGTMCYADFLRENGIKQNIGTITLIEPSEICLKRAALHTQVFFPEAEIHTVCKFFDDLDATDLNCDESTPTLHIFSNVLDILDFDLERLASLISKQIKCYNQFVCVGPYFHDIQKDRRINDFSQFVNGNITFSKFFGKGELTPGKNWTAQIVCFKISPKANIGRSQNVNSHINNNSEATRQLIKKEPVSLPNICIEYSSDKILEMCEMIFVEGGTFWMGAHNQTVYKGFFRRERIPNNKIPNYDANADTDEFPVHQVTLDSFYIGKFEVTQRLWKAIMGNNPSYFRKGDDYPIEKISWYDCQEFIQKLNNKTGKKFRLPTEAEWEYAARGGNYSRGYTYSGGDYIDKVAWYKGNSDETSHPVGQKQPNELGIYDMSGNLAEWCQDGLGEYDSKKQINPTDKYPNRWMRVVRGGNWNSDAKGCRVANRSGHTNDNADCVVIGFRLAMSVK